MTYTQDDIDEDEMMDWILTAESEDFAASLAHRHAHPAITNQPEVPMSTTTRTATQYANEVPRTFRVTFPMPRPSDGRIVHLPVLVIATRSQAHDKAAAILRERLGLPSSKTVIGKLELVTGPVGAEGFAPNNKVVPPLNKRRKANA